jgi:hypothetical protein
MVGQVKVFDDKSWYKLLPPRRIALDFMAVAFPRSGTHMLRGYLNSHPDVWCADEIFNGDIVRRTDTEDRVERLIRRFVSDANRVNGCVVHGHHTPRRKDLPEGVCYLLLRRRNILDQVVSSRVAHACNRWQWFVGTENPPGERPTISMTPEEITEKIELWRTRHAAAEKKFPEALRLWYEDVVEDPQGQMTRVFKHLGLRPCEATTNTQKIGWPTPLVLENFQDLAKHFEGTDYSEYFEAWRESD